jgi:hypothetical protein
LLIAAYASLTKASIMRIVKYALIISLLLCFFLAPAQDTIPPTPIDYDNNTIYATGGHHNFCSYRVVSPTKGPSSIELGLRLFYVVALDTFQMAGDTTTPCIPY